MRNFKYSQELKPYIRKILYSRNIPYKFIEDNGIPKISVPLSGQKFHEVVMRAKCMKKTDETGMLHLTKKESEDNKRVAYLLSENGANSFVIAGTPKE